MTVCGVPESYSLHGCLFSPYSAARSILLQLGEYCQIQEDFLNWFGTAEEVGKIRTDITGSKCSWCINVALAVASPEQRTVLEENCGRMDSEKEMRVKEIYKAIGVTEQYRIYEASLREQIEAMIAGIPEPEGDVDGCVLRREVFTSFFHKIYERK
jgi:farnesyl diphosphate synthase